MLASLRKGTSSIDMTDFTQNGCGHTKETTRVKLVQYIYSATTKFIDSTCLYEQTGYTHVRWIDVELRRRHLEARLV
jgi:hypothetical protein